MSSGKSQPGRPRFVIIDGPVSKKAASALQTIFAELDPLNPGERVDILSGLERYWSQAIDTARELVRESPRSAVDNLVADGEAHERRHGTRTPPGIPPTPFDVDEDDRAAELAGQVAGVTADGAGSAELAGARGVQRSAEAAIPDEPTAGVRTCRACGCTDAAACPGGCSWVAPDLCSSCDRKAEEFHDDVDRKLGECDGRHHASEPCTMDGETVVGGGFNGRRRFMFEFDDGGRSSRITERQRMSWAGVQCDDRQACWHAELVREVLGDRGSRSFLTWSLRRALTLLEGGAELVSEPAFEPAGESAPYNPNMSRDDFLRRSAVRGSPVMTPIWGPSPTTWSPAKIREMRRRWDEAGRASPLEGDGAVFGIHDQSQASRLFAGDFDDPLAWRRSDTADTIDAIKLALRALSAPDRRRVIAAVNGFVFWR